MENILRRFMRRFMYWLWDLQPAALTLHQAHDDLAEAYIQIRDIEAEVNCLDAEIGQYVKYSEGLEVDNSWLEYRIKSLQRVLETRVDEIRGLVLSHKRLRDEHETAFSEALEMVRSMTAHYNEAKKDMRYWQARALVAEDDLRMARVETRRIEYLLELKSKTTDNFRDLLFAKQRRVNELEIVIYGPEKEWNAEYYG